MASSALSFYVHLWAKNYLNYGLYDHKNQQQPKQPPTIDDLKLNISYIVSKDWRFSKGNKGREKKAKELQEKYQLLLYGNGKNKVEQGELNDFRNKMSTALNDMLQKQFGKAAAQVTADNLMQAKLPELKTRAAKSLEKISDDNIKNVEDFRKIVNKLKNNFDKIMTNAEQAPKKGTEDFSEWKKLSKDLENWINKIYGQKGKKTLSEIGIGIDVDTLNSYINLINKYKFPIVSQYDSTQSGEIGEWMTIWMNAYLGGMSIDTLITNMEQLVRERQIGKQGSYVMFEKDKRIQISAQRAKMLNSLKINRGRKTLQFTSHTSKSDVVLFLEQEDKSIGTLLASVKNYGKSSNLKIMQASPVTSILQASLNNKWAGHYVNTTINHYGEGLKQYATKLNALKEEGDKSFNQLALYIGLIGYSNKYAPDLFISFDYKARKVKVIDIYLLFEKLINQKISGYDYVVYIDGSKAGIQIDKVFLQQQKRATVTDRMSAIFSKLHSQKVTTKISLSL